MDRYDKIVNEVVDRLIDAYHYSNADFDQFDLGYVNTGNKGQAYGYGIYVSLSDSGASPYGKIRYMVKIPSDDSLYLNDFRDLPMSYISRVKMKLFRYLVSHDEEDMYKGVENEFLHEMDRSFQRMNGLSLYGTISTYLGSDKAASEFCYNELGKIGLKHHMENVTNVVMFDPKDIIIVKKG